MTTEFGTKFWLTLKAALLAADWTAQRHTDVLLHPSGASLRLAGGKSVSFRRTGGPGQEIIGSRKDDPEAAALDVAAQAHERVARRENVTEAP